MKKLILSIAIFLGALNVYASSPVSVVPGLPESRYDYTNGTVSLSSFTVTTFSSASPFYRQITLTSPTSFYYRVDGSTSSIGTLGYPGLANTDVSIESNQAIHLLLGDGLAATTGRYIEKRK